MRAVRGVLLTLAGLWVLGGAPLAAQDPSHALLPGRLERKSAADLLNGALERAGAERLQIDHDLDRVAGLLREVLKDPKRYGVTPEKLAELQKKFSKDIKWDPNDPKMQELARRLAGDINNIPPDQLDALKRVVGDMKPPDGAKPPDIKQPDIKQPD